VDSKAQTDPNTVIVCDFNIPLSLIGNPEKKISKETSELNSTEDQMELTDNYRLPQRPQDTSSSQQPPELSPE
jgi:hypothetical protein